MLRNLYHGSTIVLRTPRCDYENDWNDFGPGFYCTDSHDRAALWASGHGRDGFVNAYRLDDRGLRTIDLGSPRYCILHWLAVLLNYREFDTLTPMAYQARDYIRTAFAVDHRDCDCIIGWRADNIHFTYAQDFLNENISYQQLRDAVRMSGLGRQTVLKSSRALDRLLFTGYESVKNSAQYPVRISEERNALSSYSREVYRKKDISGLYISTFMLENIQEYDSRLK